MKIKIKYAILTLVYCLTSLSVFSQIEYQYDNAGNRIERKLAVELRSGEIVQDSSFSTGPVIGEETASAELMKPELEETFGNLELKVYPNPTTGVVYLELSRLPGEELSQIELWSPAGRLIEKSKITGQLTRIDLWGKPAGIYIVKTSLSGQSFTWKIIKE